MSNILPYTGSVQVLPIGGIGVSAAAFGWMHSGPLLGASLSGSNIKPSATCGGASSTPNLEGSEPQTPAAPDQGL